MKYLGLEISFILFLNYLILNGGVFFSIVLNFIVELGMVCCRLGFIRKFGGFIDFKRNMFILIFCSWIILIVLWIFRKILLKRSNDWIFFEFNKYGFKEIELLRFLVLKDIR